MFNAFSHMQNSSQSLCVMQTSVIDNIKSKILVLVEYSMFMLVMMNIITYAFY